MTGFFFSINLLSNKQNKNTEGKVDLKYVTDNYSFLYIELAGRVRIDFFFLFDQNKKIINSKKLFQIP